MMDVAHAGFIIAAYAVAFVVVAVMILNAVLDHRRLKRALSKFKDDREA